jgi:hypothetical protein
MARTIGGGETCPYAHARPACGQFGVKATDLDSNALITSRRGSA